MRVPLSLLICCAAILLQSCVALKPNAVSSKEYALGLFEEANAASMNLESSPVFIYIQPPNLPGYLDGTDLVFQRTNGEILSLPCSKWAEPLLEGIPRALGQYLERSALLRVSGYYPWQQTDKSAARLSLRFYRFFVGETGAVHVDARWSLRLPNGRERHGDFNHLSAIGAIGEAESLVTAYNGALEALAESISDTLQVDG